MQYFPSSRISKIHGKNKINSKNMQLMKKLRFYSVILLLTFLAVSMLQSCLSDADDTSNGTLFTIGTIKVIEDKEYYFNLDRKSVV